MITEPYSDADAEASWFSNHMTSAIIDTPSSTNETRAIYADAYREPAVYRPHSASFPLVTVVVPTMNEAENLPYILPRIPTWVHEVIIVDGNSTDNTVAMARSLLPGVRILMQVGRGKGDALLA